MRAHIECVLREDNGHSISQRLSDSYFDATAMCRAYGKLFANYHQLDSTREFLNALSFDVGIPISTLVQSARSVAGKVGGGTWVHPRVAYNLAQWISPEFAVKVTEWIDDLIHGRIPSVTTAAQIDPFVVGRVIGPYVERGIATGIEEGVARVLPLFQKAEEDSEKALAEAEGAKKTAERAEALAEEAIANTKMRKTLSSEDKYLLRLTSLRGFRGYCHIKLNGCLGRIVDDDCNIILDAAGRRIAEYDHHYDVGSANPRRSHLPCRNCHKLLADPPIRLRMQHAFHEFQRMFEEAVRWKKPPLF